MRLDGVLQLRHGLCAPYAHADPPRTRGRRVADA